MSNISFVVASDINPRDGIGIEMYFDEKLVMEVFRDDTARTRQVRLFAEYLPFESVEQYMRRFKEEGLWNFADD